MTSRKPPLAQHAPQLNGKAAAPTITGKAESIAAPLGAKSPQALREAWQADPAERGWQAWRELLAKRATKLAEAQTLCWGLPDEFAHCEKHFQSIARACLQGKQNKLTTLAAQWLSLSASRGAGIELGLEAVAWARLLPSAAGLLSLAAWQGLTEELVGIAQAAQRVRLPEDAPGGAVVAQHLLAGELPLTLAVMLPEVDACRSLRKEAHTALSEGVLAVCDGEGLPVAGVSVYLPLLAACWTRCRSLGVVVGKPVWSADAQLQYEWLVRQTLRLTRPDGATLLAAPHADARPLIEAALRLEGDGSDWAAARQRFSMRAPKRVRPAGVPEPSVNSEWSGIAVLSGGWDETAPLAAVRYDGADVTLDLAVGKRPLLVGDWPVCVFAGGEPVRIASEWEEQCWYSDEACDYLEIAADLSDGSRLERQVFMARRDRIGYLAEVIIHRDSEPVERRIETKLPMAEGLAFRGEGETREGLLTRGKRPLAGVLPLSLPEWRIDSSQGELATEEGCLTLLTRRTGRNLHSMLWLDFDTKRFSRQRTWRQLTVAHKLETVPRDVAVGYRVQSGIEQWLVYRSLDAPHNRTVLGQNFIAESTVGRFLPTGAMKEYYEIEGVWE